MTALGPVQMLVLGFDEPDAAQPALDQLARLEDHDHVRLLDVLLVLKDVDGTVERVHGERDVVAALVGLEPSPGDAAAADGLGEDDFWHVDDAIPAGAAALVAVVEHRWALPLQDALQDAGGFHLADAWLHPIDLVSAGVVEADEIR